MMKADRQLSELTGERLGIHQYNEFRLPNRRCIMFRLTLFSIIALLLCTSSVMGEQDHALIDERSTLVTHGKIISQKEVLVKSGIFGVIEEIYVDVGDPVKVGSPIAKVTLVPDYEKVQTAQSELAKAKIEYEYTLVNFNRVKKLHKQNLISEASFKEMEVEYQLKASAIEKLEDIINLLLNGKSKHLDSVPNIIYATSSGTVMGLEVGVGDYITAAMSFNSGTTIAHIADMNNLIFSSRISEENLSRLNIGSDLKVTLKAYPTYEISAKVESISYVGEDVNGQTFFNYIASIQDGHSNVLRVGLSAESVIR